MRIIRSISKNKITISITKYSGSREIGVYGQESFSKTLSTGEKLDISDADYLASKNDLNRLVNAKQLSISFEPDDSVYPTLIENVEKNKIKNVYNERKGLINIGGKKKI